jgi:uncharacterized protein (DUF488 family)
MGDIITSIEKMAFILKAIIDNFEPEDYWSHLRKYMYMKPALFFGALEIRYVGKKRLEKLKVTMAYEIKEKAENNVEILLYKHLCKVLKEQRVLYSIGYEGMEIDKFLNKLRKNGVKTIIDVREKPISRKKGFAKSALSSELDSMGISYMHIRELGSPDEARKELHSNNNWLVFAEKYLKHLAGQNDILVELSTMIKKGSFCLMCFERNFQQCHRGLLAKELQKLSKIEVVHL